MNHLITNRPARTRIAAALFSASLALSLFAQQEVPAPQSAAAGAAAASTNKPPAAASTNAPANPPPNAAAPGASAEDQLSFQNANVDMVVQWLAKTTGKSVVKSPKVQCQITIVGSKGLSQRESINLVYRALSLEGFTAIESSKAILIVPEGSEPKSTPEFVDDSGKLPEGRQRLVRIFQVKFISPNEAKEKIKTALSEKATVDINERGNQLIITDYTDNIRLATDLIKELDVPTSQDITVEFFPVKHGDADDIGTMLGQILNAQVTTGPAPTSSSSSRSSSSRNGPMIFGPNGPMSEPTPSPSSSGPTTTGPATSAIKIWPDRNANQLIIVAPKAKIPEIKQLLETLDGEKPQDVTIRVLPLKNVNASDLVREMAPLLQKMTGKSARDRIEVGSNDRSNTLIILSSEENFHSLEKLIAGLDREEAQEKAIRAFTLKNADAEDVAKQLMDLNQDQSNSGFGRVFIYDYYGGGNRRDNKKINVVSDRRRNTVIVQGAPTAMDDIAKLIENLDAPLSDASLAPKIYRMKFVNAADIADVLNELFLKKNSTSRMWDPYGFPMQDTSDRDARAGNKLFGKVRITSEPYSNSIIITANSLENLTAIESVLTELDSPAQGETTIRVTLNFAKAVQLASDMNVLFAKGGSPPLRPQQQQPQQPNNQFNPQNNNQTQSQNSFGLEQETKEDAYFPWLGGQAENTFGRQGESTAVRPVSDLIGKVRIVPDRRSNSILLTSNVQYFKQLLKLINDLDAPTPQVLVEARIIEVASDFRDHLGTRWSPDGTTFTGEDLENSAKISTSTMFKDVFAGNVAGNTLRSGVFDSSLKLDFLIQFLRKNANAKVLAEPQINISDNELGKLFVGAQVPIQAGSLRTDVGSVSTAVNYRDVGIILEVTPRINSSNEVVLRIRAESSSIREGERIDGQVILDTRNFRTELMVKDGETIVLGGIIQRERNEIMRKTPGLGAIPGLGWAFKKKDQTSREVELMVFLRPKITRSPEQARMLYEETKNKVPLINEWDQTKPEGTKTNTKDKPQKQSNGG